MTTTPASSRTAGLWLALLLALLLGEALCSSSSSGSSTTRAPLSRPTTSSTTAPATTTTTTTTTTVPPAIAPQHQNNQQQQQQQQQQPPRRQQAADDEYLVGVGLADITGPAADINLVSLMRLLAAGLLQPAAAAPSSSATAPGGFDPRELIKIQHPQWRELTDMGYAKPSQDAGGIHLRQFSRSIVIEDKQGKRILYMSIDNGMISQLLRTRVMDELRDNYGEHMFNESNVMMSATHSHSCPGGFFQYMLYNIPSAGFISQTLEALVAGMVRSVLRATENMRPSLIYYNEGELLDASINRSPFSYKNNPVEERAQYKYNTDKGMYLLKMVDARSGEPMAMLNWFAVHGTSMNNSNHLISSDNKGYASLLFEQEFNPPGTLPGKGKFVAIFAQANEGDVSPNTMGPRCIDTGLPCDLATSTCGNPPRNEKCIASGPGKDMFESTKIIAYKQYYRARQLFIDQASQKPVRGPVRYIHELIDMTQEEVPLYKSLVDLAQVQKPYPQIALNSTYRTCPAGLGYSFAAGTTDGPGALDFAQGDTVAGRYWNMVRDFLRRPSEEQIKCHHPKPILLSTGEMDFPYMWHPRIVPTQIMMIGQVAIVGLPGEFTTMAGRRVRNAVKDVLQKGVGGGVRPLAVPAASSDATDDAGEPDDFEDEVSSSQSDVRATRVAVDQKRRDLRQVATQRGRVKRALATWSNGAGGQPDIKVVLSGLSNIYTSYVTTVEEFAVQRYEGASTLYGPHTLQAYVNQFRKLAGRLVSGQAGPDPADQPQPPDLSKGLFTLKPGVIYDGAPHGRTFGQVLADVNSSRVYRCQETVGVSFLAGNPRNDLRQEESFLYVDRYNPANGTWTPIATDASWETKFIWERVNTLLGESRATILWDIPPDCNSGVYRIRHYGAHKSLLSQTISPYAGQSSLFKVVNSNSNDNDSSAAAQEEQLDSMLNAALADSSGAGQVAGQQQQSGATQNEMRPSIDRQHPESPNRVNQQAASPSHYSPLKLWNSWLRSWNWRS